jgi:hypothetical protein
VLVWPVSDASDTESALKKRICANGRSNKFISGLDDGAHDSSLMSTSNTNKHPSRRRYPPELRERAVRMVREAIAEGGESFGVVTRVARQLGVEVPRCRAAPAEAGAVNLRTCGGTPPRPTTSR